MAEPCQRDQASAVLADLRSVVASLVEVLTDCDARSAQMQFRAIAGAVARMEQTGTPVPEELKSMRARLAAAASATDQALQLGQTLVEAMRAEIDKLNRVGVGGSTMRRRRSAANRAKAGPASPVTGTKPVSVSVAGLPKVPASAWRDVLVGVFDLLLEAHPAVLPVVSEWQSKRGPLLSQTGQGMRQPARLRAGYYIDTHRSAADIFRQVTRLMKACGLDPATLDIETRA